MLGPRREWQISLRNCRVQNRMVELREEQLSPVRKSKNSDLKRRSMINVIYTVDILVIYTYYLSTVTSQ
jgi:hypothetical protein